MSIQFMPGVRLTYFDGPIHTAFRFAAAWGAKAGKAVIVTSLEEGTHGAGSLHPFGLAVDLDVVGNDPAELEQLYQWLRRWMPTGFDVVFEGNHVHVEFDAQRRESRTVPQVAGFAPAPPAPPE